MLSVIEAVQKMQDYIKEHLGEDINLKDLSNVSCYSPWYSYRIFKEYTSLTIADYIRRLRLSLSALQLRDNNIKIIDVALKYGYDSPDGYQRAFFKEFGCNPYDYSKNPVPITLFIPYKVENRKENRKMKTVKNVFISVVDRCERKVILKRGVKANHYFDYCEEVGCDVWGVLSSIKSIYNEPVALWLPEGMIKANTSKYVQGVEVDINYDGVIPNGYEVVTMPKAKYLMFQGEPFKEEDFEEAIEEVWDAIKKYNPEILGYQWDDSNPRIQLEPIGVRGYIELLPIIEK